MSEIGYLVGTDTHRGIDLGKAAISNSGSTDIYRLRESNDFTRLHYPPNFFRLGLNRDLSSYRCLLNLVTDPDANPKVLRVIDRVLQRYDGRVLNHPAYVAQTSRDLVAKQCSNISNHKIPKCIRLRGSINPKALAQLIDARSFVFPAILRQVGTHTGQTVQYIPDFDSLASLLKSSKSYYLTEFVDFKSDDGLFRKYRVFVIGRKFIFRHMLVSDYWEVHASDRLRFMQHHRELLEEERSYFENGISPLIESFISEISQNSNLDFLGIDFGCVNNQCVLFEANATMNFFPFLDDAKFSYVQSCLAPARAAFTEIFEY